MTGQNVPRPILAPAKFDLFGIGVSATDYDKTIAWAMQKAARASAATIDLMPVHGLIEAARDTRHRRLINQFDIVAPDGQPVRWALNGFYQTRLSDRVYGPELMLRMCAAAAEKGIGIFLYGGNSDVIQKLEQNLQRSFPSLKISGSESPPFRALSEFEDREIVHRINQSGAGIVFIGLGCPKQEIFAAEHSRSIHAVQVCVGAAFDLHAGAKEMAPRWMQRIGLEWLFRLGQEPARLWRRYLIANTFFILLVIRKLLFDRQDRVKIARLSSMK
jgi:N-acetylglucosaminyldiphosphoundecaprenol N-acetyl-beta-D-mannosaminyltransferase